MPEIKLENITKRWGKFYAVDNLNLDIEDNAFITLLGPSGCGKTTTLRMIAGLETPTSGQIKIGDRVVYDSDAGINIPPNKRKVGFLFQNYALWPNMTVYQNIAFGLNNIKEEMAVKDLDAQKIPVPINNEPRQVVALRKNGPVAIAVTEPDFSPEIVRGADPFCVEIDVGERTVADEDPHENFRKMVDVATSKKASVGGVNVGKVSVFTGACDARNLVCVHPRVPFRDAFFVVLFQSNCVRHESVSNFIFSVGPVDSLLVWWILRVRCGFPAGFVDFPREVRISGRVCGFSA